MNYADLIERKKKHIGYAKKMRNKPTKAEEKLWEHLKNKQLGHRFIRQHIVSGSIADFACPSMALVVEVDGKYHEDREYLDKKRDGKLYKFAGYNTLRFTNEEVLNDTKAVLDNIKNWLKRSQR